MDKPTRRVTEGRIIWSRIHICKQDGEVSDQVQLWILITRDRDDQVRRAKLVRLAEAKIHAELRKVLRRSPSKI